MNRVLSGSSPVWLRQTNGCVLYSFQPWGGPSSVASHCHQSALSGAGGCSRDPGCPGCLGGGGRTSLSRARRRKTNKQPRSHLQPAQPALPHGRSDTLTCLSRRSTLESAEVGGATRDRELLQVAALHERISFSDSLSPYVWAFSVQRKTQEVHLYNTRLLLFKV